MESIEFTVFGRPQQMGSKKAFVRGNRAIITDANSETRKRWHNAVASDAALAMDGRQLASGPVSVSVEFFFSRPKSHYGTGKNAGRLKASAPDRHAQSPDVDKLIRCLLDAMTGVVWRDDRQVDCVTGKRHWTEAQEMAFVVVDFGSERE